ncbi:hypothetical protein QWZ14_23445 [Paeniroseomonas aquatica]|uniref:Tetratricopeptide repeat protein n=1 Tax=Paeniroseomonas aquatica TaxID=373043 RepID=A0ABT8AC83_9PROT|nr:hypothetical protein [Paeniroseomonas aquatica]MDN3567345.1 hypothetical protein [Paeniroseomonas aquatica]
MLPAWPSSAQDRVVVRVGDHRGFGRVVLVWQAPPDYRLDEAGDQVRLRFGGEIIFDLSAADRLPRNVLELVAEPDGMRIGYRAGARPRVSRRGPSIVVDLLDPVPAAGPAIAPPAVAQPSPAAEVPAAAPPATAAPSRPRVSQAASSQAGRPEPPTPASPPSPTGTAAAAAPPQQGATAEAPPAERAVAAPPAILPRAAALVVRPVAQPGRDRAILLPYPATTGAAILRRGSQVLVLFDSPEPLDLTALRNDPVFAGLEADGFPDATLLRLPLAPPGILRARREAAGWVVQATRPAELEGAAAAADRAMALEAEGGAASRLIIRAAQPGRVVPLTDPQGGLPLLFGTVREAGQHVPVARRLPELDLLPTLLGVALLARADQVTMRAGSDRFLVSAEGGRLALDLAAARPAPSEAMTRSFDLLRQAPAQLLERLRAQQASIASAPPLTRLPLRRAAGETLLALGLPQEAQSLLGLAPGEDPQAATDPHLAALTAMAALLSGRLPQAMALRSVTLPDTDELTFWRSALAAALGDARAAAPGLAATMPLLFDYPEGLRNRLLPMVALALAEAENPAALHRLLERAGPSPDLALPRAIIAESEGRVDAALAEYDQLAEGRDRRSRARGLRRAIELRLATGRLDAGQAARALGATLFAWRDDAEEAGLRIRIAALRQAAGDARGALALLRETEALFPDRAAALRPAIAGAFLAALGEEAPLAAVALFDAYPQLLPADEQGEAALLLLAERLTALDLADRAAALLGQAAARTNGTARATLGLRQARLHFANGDTVASQAALDASAVAAIPDALQRERSILAAQVQARLGKREDAIAALKNLGGAGAEALKQLLVELQDWPAAASAFAGQLRESLPAAPTLLNESQGRLLLRQATMLVLAGDEAGLMALRGDYLTRLPSGPLAEAFTLLTADQLRGLADLPRLQRELDLFRSMPSRLEALRAGGSVTR